jgi:hypothetical protein
MLGYSSRIEEVLDGRDTNIFSWRDKYINFRGNLFLKH